MSDALARLLRELPDTDRSRYDVAYARGRAQARSAYLFGGLAVGALVGALGSFLLDPARGRARRAELGRQLTGRRNDLRRVVDGRVRDLRNRTKGQAIEAGLVRDEPTPGATSAPVPEPRVPEAVTA